MALFEGVTTVATVAAVAVAGSAFVPAPSAGPQHLQVRSSALPHDAPAAVVDSGENFMKQPLVTMQEKLGTSGLIAYGAGAGVLAAVAGAVKGRSRRVQRRAAEAKKEAAEGSADIEVAEKEAPKPVSKLAYLDEVPNSLAAKETVQNLMQIYSKEELEDPPEDSYLYSLKLYAQVYGKGPGKSTKMGWYDFYYQRFGGTAGWGTSRGAIPEVTSTTVQYMKMLRAQKIEYLTKGILPMEVPGPNNGVFPVLWRTGATFKWRGPEPFAGDQVRSLVTDGKFALDFLDNMAWYRAGLKPWQRGIEIGMAHGYFIIGPFISLGPLRNTPEAATVGLLAGCACIGAASLGGLGFSTVMKPKLPWIDEEGKPAGSGFTELVNWHLVGGLGGAGFAHALITIFGS